MVYSKHISTKAGNNKGEHTMTNNFSLSTCFINTYGEEPLKVALCNLSYEDQKQIVSKLIRRDFPNVRRGMTWGSLSNVTNHVLKKLNLPKAA